MRSPPDALLAGVTGSVPLLTVIPHDRATGSAIGRHPYEVVQELGHLVAGEEQLLQLPKEPDLARGLVRHGFSRRVPACAHKMGVIAVRKRPLPRCAVRKPGMQPPPGDHL